LPLYPGLIVAQCVCVFHVWVELVHLVEAVSGNQEALAQLIGSVGHESEFKVTALNETIIVLVLALIDAVMIGNLLIKASTESDRHSTTRQRGSLP